MTDNNENDNSGNAAYDTHFRENMVTTAVNFLLNPDVKNKSDSSKIGFLRKKGLTEAEISAAFDQARSDPRYFSSLSSSGPLLYTSPPVPYPPENYSFWGKLSRLSSSLIVVAVALYGLHRFYKMYIEPWLFGIKVESELSVLEAQLKELSNSVVQLRNAVTSLEKNIQAQSEQVERTFLTETTTYMPLPMAIADLKTEIGSVKSLLINRHQFPAPPKAAAAVNPSIPLWQLPAASEEAAADVSSESIAAANGETEEVLTGVSSENVPKTPEVAGTESSEAFHTPEEETAPPKVPKGGKARGKKGEKEARPSANGINGSHP